jgi:ADP-ribose pyrophosphatase YjhB (NUDIX family)
VEEGEDLETTLARELRKEIAGTADIYSLVYVLDNDDDRQHFYLARLRSWSSNAADRGGPEFADPVRGEYQLEMVPLTAEVVSGISLMPEALTGSC